MEHGFSSLKLHNVSVFRDGKMVLGLLDLNLTSDGVTAILGHNGAGKSLFIRACHGQFPVSSGSIQWNGQTVDKTRRARSLMFQTPPLLRRSVEANVEFPLLALGIPKPERHKRVSDALKAARLTDHATAPAASLSGGEKQRMALARALVTRPQVILLDEPSASLDPASTKELEVRIKAIAASGVKVLVATHDLMQARRLANDVLVFGEGDLLIHEDAKTFFGKTHEGAVADFLEGRL